MATGKPRLPCSRAVHVMPLKDFHDHVCSGGCWCKPLVLRDPLSDAPLVIHHSVVDGQVKFN